MVGAHVAAHCDCELKDYFTPEAIEMRFDRFGGIFSYVIPLHKNVIVTAEKSQNSVLERTKPVHVSLPGNDIEKTDESKDT